MTTTYEAGLIWTGSKFEKDQRIVVSNATGKIVQIGKNPTVWEEGNSVVNFKDKILLPGFVNCHSHAFQRGLRGKSDEGDGNFWTWRDNRMPELRGIRIDVLPIRK